MTTFHYSHLCCGKPWPSSGRRSAIRGQCMCRTSTVTSGSSPSRTGCGLLSRTCRRPSREGGQSRPYRDGCSSS
eukprot:16434729-Heterocapsa_arctica.AAC.1